MKNIVVLSFRDMNNLREKNMSVEMNCKQCSHIFKIPQSRYKNGERKYCSKQCFHLSLRVLSPILNGRILNKNEYDKIYYEATTVERGIRFKERYKKIRQDLFFRNE